MRHEKLAVKIEFNGKKEAGHGSQSSSKVRKPQLRSRF
jgi:hypothetical protein